MDDEVNGMVSFFLIGNAIFHSAFFLITVTYFRVLANS